MRKICMHFSMLGYQTNKSSAVAKRSIFPVFRRSRASSRRSKGAVQRIRFHHNRGRLGRGSRGQQVDRGPPVEGVIGK